MPLPHSYQEQGPAVPPGDLPFELPDGDSAALAQIAALSREVLSSAGVQFPSGVGLPPALEVMAGNPRTGSSPHASPNTLSAFTQA